MKTSRTLVLMRHAKAEAFSAGGDEMRPLSLPGRRQASRAGIALLQAQVSPEVVLCSPAIRTRQTADLAITSLGCRGDLDLVFPDDLYRGFVSELLAELSAIDARTRTVMVVGHEPTMSAACVTIAGAGSDPDAVASVHRGLRTATCAVFDVEAGWDEVSDGAANLVRLLETPAER